MKDLFYTLVLALGTVLILTAMSVASIGYLLHIIKPTAERAELQYIKDTNATME